MPVLRLGYQTLDTDEAGFIQDFGAWSEDLAQYLAHREGMGSLSADKLEVLHCCGRHE